MTLIERWAFILCIKTISASVFTPFKWQFYAVAILSGISVGNLFSEKK